MSAAAVLQRYSETIAATWHSTRVGGRAESKKFDRYMGEDFAAWEIERTLGKAKTPKERASLAAYIISKHPDLEREVADELNLYAQKDEAADIGRSNGGAVCDEPEEQLEDTINNFWENMYETLNEHKIPRGPLWDVASTAFKLQVKTDAAKLGIQLNAECRELLR